MANNQKVAHTRNSYKWNTLLCLYTSRRVSFERNGKSKQDSGKLSVQLESRAQPHIAHTRKSYNFVFGTLVTFHFVYSVNRLFEGRCICIFSPICKSPCFVWSTLLWFNSHILALLCLFVSFCSEMEKAWHIAQMNMLAKINNTKNACFATYCNLRQNNVNSPNSTVLIAQW